MLKRMTLTHRGGEDCGREDPGGKQQAYGGRGHWCPHAWQPEWTGKQYTWMEHHFSSCLPAPSPDKILAAFRLQLQHLLVSILVLPPLNYFGILFHNCLLLLFYISTKQNSWYSLSASYFQSLCWTFTSLIISFKPIHMKRAALCFSGGRNDLPKAEAQHCYFLSPVCLLC